MAGKEAKEEIVPSVDMADLDKQIDHGKEESGAPGTLKI